MMFCMFCRTEDITINRSIHVKHLSVDYRICFNCIRVFNTQVAHKYREQGWHVTKDALIVNTEYNTEKESA